MKAIDNKGRIFGKINIIDLIVVLVLILGIALVGYKMVKPVGAQVAVAGEPITYTVKVPAVTQSVYDEIMSYLPGDQLMANGEMVDGYVVDCIATPHINYNVDQNGNMVTSVEENGRLDLTFVIEATASNALTNLVGTQEVRVGKGHIVKTTNFEFTNGIIQSIG